MTYNGKKQEGGNITSVRKIALRLLLNREAHVAVGGKYKYLNFSEESAKEDARVKALKAKVPASQRLATQKFVIKVQRIFNSMPSYAAKENAILRKDIDRYDDAIVEATGQVPKEVIAYVEEAYRAIKNSVAIDDYDSNIAATTRTVALVNLTVW